jgi:hypothetical protein
MKAKRINELGEKTYAVVFVNFQNLLDMILRFAMIRYTESPPLKRS